MNSSLKLILDVLLRLTALLALVLVAALFPVFSVFRYVFGLYLSRKYNHHITFLRGMDFLFFLYDETTPFNIDGWHIFKGTCDIDKLRKRIEERWLQPQEPDGRWKHIKLRQQVKKELGYYFWIPQTDFRIENHVTLYDGPQLKNKADFEKFMAKHTLDLPVEKGIFWRITLINLPDTFVTKVPEKQFMILYTTAHGLFDGVSVYRFHQMLFDEFDSEILYLPEKKNGNLKYQISHWINVLVNGLVEGFLDLLTNEKHALLGPKLTGNKLVSISELLDIQKVKVIKNYFKTTVNDVIYSCVTGALRRFLLSENEEIPSLIRCKVPFSLHSLKLERKIENNITFRNIQMPVDEVNCVKRLRKIKKALDELKTAPDLYISPLIVTLIFNRFPIFIPTILAKLGSSTTILTSVPMIFPNRLLGCEEKQQFVGLGASNGISGCGMNITISTHVNTLICAFKVDSGIVKSQDHLDKMIGFFSEEMDELYRATGQKLVEKKVLKNYEI